MSLRTAPARFLRSGAVLACAACVRDAGDDASPAPVPAAPALVAVSVSCDAGPGEWRFEAETDAWTGNGQVLLSTDGDYVERHPLYSTSAAPDGSKDTLALALTVVPDWRDVTPGSTTFFNCLEPALTGILRVFTADGSAQADCRAFGTEPERWGAWSTGVRCEQLLE